MAKPTYARCRYCGAHRDDGADLSTRGLCATCRKERYHKQNDDLHYHRGEVFLQWRRQVAASVGAVLVDDILRQE